METRCYSNSPAIGPHSAVISPRVYLFLRSFPCNQSKFCGHLTAPYLFCRIFAVDLILLILLCYYSCNFLLPSSSFHLMCQPNLSQYNPLFFCTFTLYACSSTHSSLQPIAMDSSSKSRSKHDRTMVHNPIKEIHLNVRTTFHSWMHLSESNCIAGVGFMDKALGIQGPAPLVSQ